MSPLVRMRDLPHRAWFDVTAIACPGWDELPAEPGRRWPASAVQADRRRSPARAAGDRTRWRTCPRARASRGWRACTGGGAGGVGGGPARLVTAARYARVEAGAG
jgi:hypothetical protein